MTFSSVSSLPPFPALDFYTEAAKAGQDLYVHIDGTQHRVLSWGTTPQGRSVAWLAPDVDTTSMFTQALTATYGQGIASAVAKQLGLEPSPGKPLSSRTVQTALDMANHAKEALMGVDFISRLNSSAVGNTPIFLQACRDCHIEPQSISAEMRQKLDLAMQARFESAAMSGNSPVPLSTAGQWLRELLQAKVHHN